MPEIAKQFGYTSNYFSSLFNKYMAMNFNDYLNYVRYEKAKSMLSDASNKLTVLDVAEACGFGSMNTFYRAKNKFENRNI